MSDPRLAGIAADISGGPVQTAVREVPPLASAQEPKFGPAWEHFTRWCAANGKDPRARSQAIIRETLKGYVTSENFKALKPTSQSTYLNGITAVYKNIGQRLEQTDISEIRKLLPKPEPRQWQISDEQVIQLVNAMPTTQIGIRNRAIVLLIRAFNFRRSEVQNLNAEDITFVDDEMIIKFRRARGRGAGEMKIARRNDRLCSVTALKAWLEASQITVGPLFPTARGEHRRVTEATIRNVIAVAGRRIGLNELTTEALRPANAPVRYIHFDPAAKPEPVGLAVSTEVPLVALRAPLYSAEQFSSESAIPVETIRVWENRLKRKKHVIFQGPPGTGKTFVAERLARLLTSESFGFRETLQFHPSYSYEDFIQGIRPVTRGGQLTFEPTRGRFMQFCDKAAGVPDGSPCVLIIDEINRGNLSRIFGELMYLLEYRDQEIPLAGEERPFGIPRNVHLIGTMNTADRSVALVDHALRRRFSFIHLGPDYDVLRSQLERAGISATSLVATLQTMNASIGDRNYEVGISFFLKEGENLRLALQDIWEGEIEPYLEEFFNDQPGKVEPYRWKTLVTNQLADWNWRKP